MKVLVTGSEGFIGKNLCSFLRKRGFEVEEYDTKIHARFPILNGIYALIHLGANASTTETDLKKILKENFEVSRNMYEMCSANGIKFQYASSASVYGRSNSFKEEGFYQPLNPYGFSKYMFDCWLLNQKYPYQGFRYFNVYGQGEDHKGDQASPIHTFIKQAKQEQVIKVFADSNDKKRDFVHVDDVCEAHFRMLYSDATGVFNIGTGQTTSFLDIAQVVANKYSAKIEEIPMPDHLKGHYQYHTKADNTKLLERIGEIDWKTVQDYLKFVQ